MESVQPSTIFKDNLRAAKSKSQQTSDGFQNFAAKLGVAPPGGLSNNVISKGQYLPNLMTRNRIELEYAYRGSWIARKAIDIKAEDMTRAGVDIHTNKGAEKIQELKVQMSRLKVWWSLANTVRWGKLYGGACGVIQIKGQKPDTPLDLDTIQKDQFQGLVVYDRWQLYPVLEKLIQSGPDMGLPEFYDIVLGSNLNDPGREPGGQVTTQANGRVRVHYSRCVRIIGQPLPFFQAITEMMWGESELEVMWDRLIEYDDAIASTGGLINKAQLRTVSIDGFREILAAGGEAQEALIKQFEYMREFQTSEGLTLLDKLDVFAAVAYSFGGLADTLLQFKQEIGGGFDIPLVRFFGQSPSGLNATGESDLRLYYDGINAKQEFELRNPVEMILKCMWRSCFGEAVPDDLTFKFAPLWQMTSKEKSEVAKSSTDTIIEAHQEGGISTAVMMKELKNISNLTGIFTHITEEEIEEADNEEPPIPEVGPSNPTSEIAPKEKPSALPAKDSIFKRMWNVIKPLEQLVEPKKVSQVTDAQKIKNWLSKQ